MMARMFGTDGVRGIANRDLTCDLAYRLGQASAYVLASDVHRPTILVGRDTRISGEMLESALVAGICSVGARAVLVEVLPTPAIAYLTRYYEADAGVVYVTDARGAGMRRSSGCWLLPRRGCRADGVHRTAHRLSDLVRWNVVS